MSIPNFIHKIKSKIGIDKATIMSLIVVVGVGISSFGLGRISVENKADTNQSIKIEQNQSFVQNKTGGREDVEGNQAYDEEKRYVASKNGKMYYSPGCSGAKKINPENEVWFKTREDAEKSGYLFSSTCK